jgi:aspartate racemase
MAQGLEAQGADFLVMPCNTAHYYLPAIARAVRIPMLDMVQLAIGKLSGGPRRVGLLASPAVRLVGLYKARMEQAGLDAIFPDASHEEGILGVIRAVKAGKQGDEQQKDYVAVARHLRQAGAGALLVACTELSVLTLPDMGCPVVDTLDVLVEATINAARG